MESGIAKASFIHNNIAARKGEVVQAPLHTMRELARANLVEWKEGEQPPLSQDAGASSSASPAAQASPRKTANRSAGGGKKGQAKEASS